MGIIQRREVKRGPVFVRILIPSIEQETGQLVLLKQKMFWDDLLLLFIKIKGVKNEKGISFLNTDLKANCFHGYLYTLTLTPSFH